MIFIRNVIVETLKREFPAFGDNVRPYIGAFGESDDPQLSYKAAPAVLVAILPAVEPPPEFDSWQLQLNFGIAIATKEAKASDADKAGWILATKVGKIVWRNCWGFQRGMEITPAIIDGIQKQQRVDPKGTPTGIWYWTVNFHNFATFDVALKDTA